VITEHALLSVTPGRETEFEHAFAQARPIIASMPGFLDLHLLRGIERESTFLLLVDWESVEHHEVGFRQSAEYQEWRALLHHFYEPMPLVEHFRDLSI